ncbi:MAG: glycosyltransferase, partial [Bacilli bacterium]|nr:glycosyltransferase [Bacilli bacterium]
MKILVVCQYYYPENFTVTPICESLAARGHDVLVVTGKPNYGYGRILEGYEKIREETLNGVRVRRVNLYPRKKSRISIIRNYLSFWRNSKRYVARLKEEFDVVYSMSLSPIISVSAANKYAKKHSIPHVLHCLDLWPESVLITHALRKNSLSYALLYRWSKSIYSKASKILLSSPSFADYFRDVLNIDNVPLVYTPQPPLL